MTKIRGACIALGAAFVITGATFYHSTDFDTAQAGMDRETVDCLTRGLTRDEKVRIARLTTAHDREGLDAIYGDVLARCVVRSDQWERRPQLLTSARQILSHDPEFRQMLNASTMELATRR
ncbi:MULTISPECIES: hypothetical protein [Caballeronia]|uniref:hypothetical protein n=1 Tax=Caballeronia TaxID=1827195 RepID=UPI001588D618|nr:MULTISPECIES: hypothetical protein [Caballeronia]MCG7401182.1 hypothetical protein [Caballeronia zhejiangensis]MCI1044473.1 hypothetical protein [Caballeronia zhejiangensis]